MDFLPARTLALRLFVKIAPGLADRQGRADREGWGTGPCC